MSTRYVWNKYSLSSTTTESVGDYNTVTVYDTDTIQFGLSANSLMTGTINDIDAYFDQFDYEDQYDRVTVNGSTYDFFLKYNNVLYVAERYYNYGNRKIYRVWPYTTHTTYSKGSTSYGYVTNAGSSKYPSNSYSGSYWYVSAGSDSIDPSSITIPSNVKGSNGSITATVTPVSNTYGGTVSYTYSYSTNGGTSWTNSGSATTEISKSISIPSSANTIQVRVQAKDNLGFTSTTYVTSNTATIEWNASPVISNTDTSIGIFDTNIPSYEYTVTDDDGDMVTVTEMFDNVVRKTYSPTLGTTNTFTFTNNEWLEILNGNHTITITADDGNGGTSTRTVTFTKNVTSLSAMFAVPLTADANVEVAVESLLANLPEGSECTIEVCNNGFDESPTWEDVTQKVLANEKFMVTNKTKTADKWGYNVRISISRGTATGEVSFFGLSGFFE